MDLFELTAKIELDSSEYEKSVRDAAKKSDDLEDALKDAANSVNDAEDSLDDLGDAAKNTSKETDDLGKSTENSSESLFAAVLKADLFTGALSKVGEMALDVAQYIWGLDEATEQYRASQSKLNTAYKVAGFSADTAKTAFRGLYKVVGDIDQATEASQLLAQLALSTEDITNWTNIATGVVGTFGDSLPIESLIESANETARVGQVVGTLADALNWAGMVGEDEFNVMLQDCHSQADRLNLITETLNGTYSDAANEFRNVSGAAMEARDSFLDVQDASAKAGKAVAEMKTSLEQSAHYAKTGFFEAITDLTEALTNLNGGTKSSKDLYREWADTVETKLKTGSIEEATAAFEELGRVVQYFDEHPIDAIFQFGGFFSAYGAQEEINGLLQVAQDRFSGAADAANQTAEAEDRLAAASVEVVEEVEPLIASAGGLSVQLENTGMSAEQASSRLQTYTDAATDMFDKISTESELSYADAVANLEANIQATEDFANNLTALAGSLPPQLAEMFAAGGPQIYAGTVAMLAEANKGTDEGLSQLNALWEQGGETAVNAFITSLGMIPEDTDDPAKVVASRIDQDTSMEAAGVSVVDRTAGAMSDAVSAAGFDASGQYAMTQFIIGMESKRSQIVAKAESLAKAAKDKIDKVLDNIGNGGGSGTPHAGGLDYVPYNNYPAVLHAGEAVLTAREATEWRNGGSTDNSRKITVNQYISVVPQTPAEFAAATEAYLEQAVWRL